MRDSFSNIRGGRGECWGEISKVEDVRLLHNKSIR